MKTLVIITHPNLEQSRINRTWMQELKKHEEITIHTLYQAYPDGKINVAHEQSLLESHDRIILQFPFYWYSTPSLLKQWQDDLLLESLEASGEGSIINVASKHNGIKMNFDDLMTEQNYAFF